MLEAAYELLRELAPQVNTQEKGKCWSARCQSRRGRKLAVFGVAGCIARAVLEDEVDCPPSDIQLCSTCLTAALALWHREVFEQLTGLGCHTRCVQGQIEITRLYSPAGQRTLVVSLRDFTTIRVIDATSTQWNTVFHDVGSEVEFGELQQLIRRFFEAPMCNGVENPGFDLRETCEGYSDDAASSRSFSPKIGNCVTFALGVRTFVGVCHQPSVWRMYSVDCEQMIDRTDGNVCTACVNAHSSSKSAIYRQTARRKSILANFNGFCEEHRVGPGLIRRLGMTELQHAATRLWDQSDIRDSKLSYTPGTDRGEPCRSDPDTIDERCTRSTVDDTATRAASVSLLKESLREIGKELNCIASKLEAALGMAREARCISMQQLTCSTVCLDLMRRYVKLIQGEKAGSIPFSPESLHFFVAAYQKLGKSNWMFMRNMLPLPHESYLREAKRGEQSREGIKYSQILEYLKASIHRRRQNSSELRSESVYDVVLSFDEMAIREKYEFNALSREVTGSTTELNLRSCVDLLSTSSGEDAQTKRRANSWLTFIATPLLGGYEARFTAASFAVRNLTSGELLKYLLNTTTALTCYGFRVRVIVCDGASTARRVQHRILTHTERDLLQQQLGNQRLSATKVAYEDPIVRNEFTVFVSDPSHWLKKIANNLFRSQPGGTRNLFIWSERSQNFAQLDFERHLKQPFVTLQQTSELKIEKSLTPAIFQRDSNFAKLKVRPAARLLSKSMADVLDRYAGVVERTVPDLQAATTLQSLAAMRDLITMVDTTFDLCNGRDKTIEKLCKKQGAIQSKIFLRFDSPELDTLQEFSRTLDAWKTALLQCILDGDPAPCSDGEARWLVLHQNFISWQTEFDSHLCVNGIAAFVRYYTHSIRPGSTVYPRILSSDVCENHFARMRSFLGSGTNPTTRQAASMEASAEVFRLYKVHWRGSNCQEFVDENAEAAQHDLLPEALQLHPRKRCRANNPRKALRHLQASQFMMLKHIVTDSCNGTL